MLSWIWGPTDTEKEKIVAKVHGYSLSEPQNVALIEMRNRFKLNENENEADANFALDDLCLMRYLRARKWDVDAAEKMLRATIAWRQEQGLKSWRGPRDFGWQFRKGKMYQHGFDKRGRPIIVMRSHESPQGTTDTLILNFMLYSLERSIQTMPAGVEQSVWLMDMATYDLRYNGGLRFTIQLVGALQNHYPERLGHLIIMNSPVAFRAIWSGVKPFVDPKTRDKIHFVKKGDAVLHELIDDEVLEVCFGGQSEEGYDHAKYMQFLSGLDCDLWGEDAATVDEGDQPYPIVFCFS